MTSAGCAHSGTPHMIDGQRRCPDCGEPRPVTQRCGSCRAAIRWVTTTNGRSMPIDPDPVDGGNLVLTYPSPGSALAIVVDPEQTMLDDPPRYVSHFATCPNADQHRTTRGTRA